MGISMAPFLWLHQLYRFVKILLTRAGLVGNTMLVHLLVEHVGISLSPTTCNVCVCILQESFNGRQAFLCTGLLALLRNWFSIIPVVLGTR